MERKVKGVLSFFLIGCMLTFGALALFIHGWLYEGQFLFGPFIATLVGMNYLFISFVQMKRERDERKQRSP
ncbi:hypothetical protein M3212_13875 [Alkalihalobacillus oceani]|uniref:hypothetical protein n=1 Tax=Halalkalibacter oceani TaxID=1653776 RepID=UPI00203B6380|nr:hypothetical protein [Halalkalibacter oceani]MCM3761861.1 hypothetical protein [Halalkalibacter oceani]